MALRLDGKRELDIETAAKLLRRGGLVAFPTETVYGLGGRGLQPRIVERIYEAKGRPSDNPLILHVDSYGSALPLWRSEHEDDPWRARADALAEAFWPGPLTLVAWASAMVPESVRAGLPKVAVREPQHEVAKALIGLVGEPVAAPSANRSGRPSPTSADDVLETLAGHIDAVLDGGPCAVGLESTVVDITGDVPRVLRPGGLPLGVLREVLPDLEGRLEGQPTHTEASPGLRHRHYAPRVERIVLADVASLGAAWARDDAVLVRAETARLLEAERGPRPAGAVTEVLPGDALGFGRELFAALYRLERRSPDVLVLERPPDDDDWTASRDRLLRAASEES
jgi:L-threonylcarbamoyladenylate synthase